MFEANNTHLVLAYDYVGNSKSLCDRIGGLYYNTTDSCYQFYEYPKNDWKTGMEDCNAMAPQNMIGRLAYVPNEDIYDQICSARFQGWIGLKAGTPGSPSK